MKEIFIYILSYLFIIVSFLPFAKSKHWFFRNCDFIRLQVLFLLVCSFLSVFFLFEFNTFKIISLVAIVIAMLVQLKVISPYINLKNRDKKKNTHNKQVLKILSSNVYQENKNYTAFLDLVKKLNPDIILVMETDQEWVNNLTVLEKDYPNFEKVPLDNTYGMCFYSKLKTHQIKTHYFFG